jgi:hypothetical protein
MRPAGLSDFKQDLCGSKKLPTPKGGPLVVKTYEIDLLDDVIDGSPPLEFQ